MLAILLFAAAGLNAGDSPRIVRADHYVKVRSIAPSMQGQTAQIYVREVAEVGQALRGATTKVVLFVHGAGTPAEVAFDPSYEDYSWMAFLARAGYDVFSMDMTGYGRSTRPHPMNDPCNLAAEQQQALAVKPCAATYNDRVTTMDSDWNDIGAVVAYLRQLRKVEKVSLIGWSLGGPRAGGFTAQNPALVDKLILLAPAYNLGGGRTGGGATAPFNAQTRADFDANWDRQLGCPNQFDMGARESVWREMLASDPVGSTWGTGVRRAPNVAPGKWNTEVVSKMQTPALFVAAAHDKQITPGRVRQLHTDYAAKNKVFADLACSSHNALWERNHLPLFRASLEFLDKGTVNGAASGEVKLGY